MSVSNSSLRGRCIALACGVSIGLAACGGTAPPPASDPFERGDAQPFLNYYQALGRMGGSELTRERAHMQAQPNSPTAQLRLAMLLGMSRNSSDIARAQNLADSLVKSSDPSVQPLQPLARLLAEQYAERLRLDALNDRQGAQIKEGLRRNQELQEKLDGLADIERTLPRRRNAGTGEKR